MTSVVNTSSRPLVNNKEIARYRDAFERDGFVLVPGVLAKSEVQQLRDFFKLRFSNPETYFEGNDYFECMLEIFERYEELSWLLFREPTISILREILGENFVLMRGASVHYNRYGWWWHKDTSNEERAGHTYHLHPEYRQVIATYYLQDNTRKYGGGLDVEPGTHTKPDPGFQQPAMVEAKDPWWRTLLGKPSAEKKMVPDYNDHLVKRPYSIPSRAGDLVIFDVKINHRASQKTATTVPPEHEKFAIFTNFSRNNETVALAHNYVNGIFEKELDARQYPNSIIQKAKELGVHLA